MSTNKPTFMELIKEFMDAINQTRLPVLLPFMSSFIIAIIGIFLSIYYIFTIVSTLLQKLYIKVPLNEDTLEYDAIPSTSFFTISDYNMWLFILFPIISFILLALIPIFSSKLYVLPTIIKNLSWALLFHNILVLFGFSIFFFNARYQSSLVNKRLSTLDKFICSKLYRSMDVLSKLQTPKSDYIAMVDNIKSVLSKISSKISDYELAKVFYTLHLYTHYHKIGIRNPRIQNALSTFSATGMLLGQCKPSKYFNRYGTFIEDINETIKTYLPSFLPKNNKNVKEALNTCYIWVSQTNNMANSIYPEDALRPFLSLSFANTTVQIVSLVVLSYFVAEGEMFRDAVNKIANTVQVATFGVAA